MEKLTFEQDLRQAYKKMKSPSLRKKGHIDTYKTHYNDFSLDEIGKIISGSSQKEKQRLSYSFYQKDGFYRRILLYYATLLNYMGILIPSPKHGKKLSKPFIKKKYFQAVEYVDNLPLKTKLAEVTLEILMSGVYYGAVKEASHKSFVMIDLPINYCRSRFTDYEGNALVEFDVSYFDIAIKNDRDRKQVLETYPKVISDHYEKYSKRMPKVDKWVFLPTSVGIAFAFPGTETPMFLSTIPATIEYDEAVGVEREKALEEIRKIIIQKIPHLSSGELLFEPSEAEVMHKGVVGMLEGNRNISVMTTYADADAITSRTSADNISRTLEKMLQNIYAEAGTSSLLFAPTTAQALEVAIQNDISLMMNLANQYSTFLSTMINDIFGNSNISLKYVIIPISYYNQKDYITNSMKLAQSGYSFILPSLALGLNQSELTSVKELENDVLKLQDKLIPLFSSFTQSGKDQDNKGGAPKKEVSEKADGTIENEDSLGGSNNE